MSIIPFLFDINPWEVQRRPRYDWDVFGLGLAPRSVQPELSWPQWLNAARRHTGSDLNPAVIGKDGGLEVSVDVQQFKPEEITVKTVDNTIVIEGKHEEREDEHGFISRHFVRKYTLPKGFKESEVISTLSSDGVLTIKAPKPVKELEGKERIIQIQETGPVRESIKDKSDGDTKPKL